MVTKASDVLLTAMCLLLLPHICGMAKKTNAIVMAGNAERRIANI